MRKIYNDLRNKISSGWLATIIITIILVLCIFLIFESIMVVGSSMYPNFVGGTASNPKSGDKVIISKIYGIQRGDVIVFYNESYKENMIKRVIAVEGDIVDIINNELYVNNELVEEDYINEPMYTDDLSLKVGKNQLFVMGDNRNVSEDSRRFGTISKKTVTGEVIIRVSSSNGKIYFI